MQGWVLRSLLAELEVVPLMDDPRERKPSVCMLFGGMERLWVFRVVLLGWSILKGSVLIQCECGRGGTSVKVARP